MWNLLNMNANHHSLIMGLLLLLAIWDIDYYKSTKTFSKFILLLFVNRLNSNDVLLRIVGSWSSTSIDCVDLLSREHVNGVFDRAHGMADGTAGAIGLHNLGECAITLELDSLIAWVGAGQEAATALQALLFVDNWGEELVLCHLVNRRNVLQLRTYQVWEFLDFKFFLVNFRVKLGKVQRRELASPALGIEIFSAQTVNVSLQTGLKIIKDGGGI